LRPLYPLKADMPGPVAVRQQSARSGQWRRLVEAHAGIAATQLWRL